VPYKRCQAFSPLRQHARLAGCVVWKEVIMDVPPGAEDLEWLYKAFKEYLPRILNYCLKYSESSAQAEDACQEVFLRALKSLPQLRAHPNLGGWLYRTAWYVTSEEWRRERRQKRDLRLLAFAEGRRDREQEREDALIQERRLIRLRIAIKCLNPSEQDLIQWSLEGIPYSEMASRLGITNNAVGTRLHRARLALKRAYCSIDSGGL
jgi:RNA polymerase sigma factor (sigma-70 family)